MGGAAEGTAPSVDSPGATSETAISGGEPGPASKPGSSSCALVAISQPTWTHTLAATLVFNRIGEPPRCLDGQVVRATLVPLEPCRSLHLAHETIENSLLNYIQVAPLLSMKPVKRSRCLTVLGTAPSRPRGRPGSASGSCRPSLSSRAPEKKSGQAGHTRPCAARSAWRSPSARPAAFHLRRPGDQLAPGQPERQRVPI